jgi:hypothetical protein
MLEDRVETPLLYRLGDVVGAYGGFPVRSFVVRDAKHA